MALTPEDIALIRQIVSNAVDAALQKKSAKRSTDYTQVCEIRSFIGDNLEALYEEFGVDQPFDVAVLRHWFSKRLPLKERDLEVMNDGKPRWHSQLQNAIYPSTWPNGVSPIQPASRRGFYSLRRIEPIFTPFLEL